jgi:hypothetical protein
VAHCQTENIVNRKYYKAEHIAKQKLLQTENIANRKYCKTDNIAKQIIVKQ